MGSLGLTLAAVAMLTVPAVLYLIAWPIGFRAQIHFGQMAWILAKTILIPISLGLTVRALVPDVAERLSRTLGRAGMAGILVVVVFAGMAVLRALFAMDLWSYVVMASIAIAAVAIGHALGPPNPHERTALAVECGVRHPGLAIAIASATYGTERALPVLIPCVITFIVVATVYMSLRRRVT
jgi:BASS family bile acid:Na+ symporter